MNQRDLRKGMRVGELQVERAEKKGLVRRGRERRDRTRAEDRPQEIQISIEKEIKMRELRKEIKGTGECEEARRREHREEKLKMVRKKMRDVRKGGRCEAKRERERT